MSHSHDTESTEDRRDDTNARFAGFPSESTNEVGNETKRDVCYGRLHLRVSFFILGVRGRCSRRPGARRTDQVGQDEGRRAHLPPLFHPPQFRTGETRLSFEIAHGWYEVILLPGRKRAERVASLDQGQRGDAGCRRAPELEDEALSGAVALLWLLVGHRRLLRRGHLWGVRGSRKGKRVNEGRFQNVLVNFPDVFF